MTLIPDLTRPLLSPFDIEIFSVDEAVEIGRSSAEKLLDVAMALRDRARDHVNFELPKLPDTMIEIEIEIDDDPTVESLRITTR